MPCCFGGKCTINIKFSKINNCNFLFFLLKDGLKHYIFCPSSVMHITNPKLTSLGPNIDLYSLTHLFIHSFITASTVYIQQKHVTNTKTNTGMVIKYKH